MGGLTFQNWAVKLSSTLQLSSFKQLNTFLTAEFLSETGIEIFLNQVQAELKSWFNWPSLMF